MACHRRRGCPWVREVVAAHSARHEPFRRAVALDERGRVITEHSRFQLAATKLGREVVFQVTVFQKEERRRRKLFAATQCSDPFHFLIQFIIREAPDFESLLGRFVTQLVHRGFEPDRMRMRSEGRWDEWLPVPSVDATAPGATPTDAETARDGADKAASKKGRGGKAAAGE